MGWGLREWKVGVEEEGDFCLARVGDEVGCGMGFEQSVDELVGGC